MLGGDGLADDNDSCFPLMQEVGLVGGKLCGNIPFIDPLVESVKCILALKRHLRHAVVVNVLSITAQEEWGPVRVRWPTEAFARDASQISSCELEGPVVGAETVC